MLPYAPAAGCDAQLNALCDRICPHREKHGSLLARHLGGQDYPAESWRCYAKETLSADGTSFVGGTTYCTRHQAIVEELQKCLMGIKTTTATVDAGGAAHVSGAGQRASFSAARPQQPPSPSPQRKQEKDEPWVPFPDFRRMPTTPAPSYEHDASYLTLPDGIRVPSVEDCGAEMAASASFWAISLYTSGYAHKAERLHASCKAWDVCCSTSAVPEGTFYGEKEGSLRERHRLIATKPLFILRALEASPLPLAWLDVDLEFHAWPSLFTPQGWATTLAPPAGPAHPPRDVLLWNWQGNVSVFQGRRLKTASGVMWYNTTDAAKALLLAWCEAMAYAPNTAAPDDQTLDVLVNEDGWIDRAAFGWLPAAYLRMMPRHAAIAPVLDHDRGMPVSGANRNSNVKPILPPRTRT